MKLDYTINIWQIVILVSLILLLVYVKVTPRINIDVQQTPFMSCVSEYNYKIDKLCFYYNDTQRNMGLQYYGNDTKLNKSFSRLQ